MKLNAKSLEVLIKRKLGSAEIAEEFGVPEEKLPDLIHQVINNVVAADSYIRKISKNDSRKKREKKGKDMGEETTIPVETEVTEEDNLDSEESEMMSEETYSLDELKELEQEQRYRTAGQEVRVKETIQEYRGILTAVTEKVKEVAELTKKINEAKGFVDKLETDAILILEKHDAELELLHQEQRKLKEIQDEIMKRTKVVLLVYEDGTIGVEGPFGEDELFINWKESMSEIMEEYDEVVENLTLKQIKQIAKLISVPYSADYTYEFSFDSEEMESIFKTLVELKDVA